jgi:DMSO/TMAO reductase YedYZ heme-binding membrane subunit
MNPQIWWYLARATGMVAWVLLVGSVVWGVLLATRVLKPVDRPAWLLVMHRWLAALAVTCTGLHLVALAADSYVQFGWTEMFVPGASPWKTTAVGIGVVAFWLLVIVQVSSLLMRRLPRTVWRRVHYLSYAMVWAVSVHAGLAGSDVSNRVYQFVALLLTITAVSAATVRVLTGRRMGGTAVRSAPPRRSAPAEPEEAAAGTAR